MAALLMTTLPIWLMIGLGFVAVRTGYFDGAHIAALGQFTLKVALIALILQAIAVPRDAGLNLPFMLAYAAAGLATMLLGFAAVRWGMGRPAVESWGLALGMGNSNSGFLGLPIAVLVFGPVGGQVFAMTMLIENALTLPFALAMASLAAGQGAGFGAMVAQTARRVATNPLIVAVLVALAWRATGLTLPDPALRTLGAVAAAALPVAWVVIGGTVARMQAGGHAPQAAAVALGKLVLHPLLAFAALSLVPGVPAALVPVGVLFASVAMLTIYPILVAPFGLIPVASAAMILTTALSLASVPVVLALLGAG